MSKYRVLIDYGSEGMRLWDEDGFDDLTEAVKTGQDNSYGSPFLIIQIVDWQATPLTDNPDN